MVVDGQVVWSGKVWAWDGGVPVIQGHPPSDPIIPFGQTP
jgi:hypothetical protein